ncbi:alpha/beta fold hydrolase [Thalassolituus sp.]|uniref:alpha/beta hydrolase n=1 Tax=Thalassolituus sp. TaxID=2030822 RepID=UPI0035135D05
MSILRLSRRQNLNASPRRLVLLHGAGIPGDLTWRWVAQYLIGWDEIYIPDLPAMGRSEWLGSKTPGFSDYQSVLCEWVASEGWQDYDLAGYSFGGLLAMHMANLHPPGRLALIEPASLLSVSVGDLHSRARAYHELSLQLHESSEKAVVGFLDLVSPRRNRALDALAVKRLRENVEGLALGVGAVGQALNEHGDWYCTWEPPTKGVSIVGGLSDPGMHRRHQMLAENDENWFFQSLENTDHGLVYTKTREIAKIINSLL